MAHTRRERVQAWCACVRALDYLPSTIFFLCLNPSSEYKLQYSAIFFVCIMCLIAGQSRPITFFGCFEENHISYGYFIYLEKQAKDRIIPPTPTQNCIVSVNLSMKVGQGAARA